MLIFNKDKDLIEYLKSGKDLPDNFVFEGLELSKIENSEDTKVYSDLFEQVYLNIYSDNTIEIYDNEPDDEIDF